MAKTKTGVGRFLQKVGQFFASLWRSAKKAFDNQPEEVQKALLNASGIIHEINENTEADPELIMEAITAKFGISEAEINNALEEAGALLNLPPLTNATDIIRAIQKYLSGKTGAAWANAADGLAKVMAIKMAPKGTKFTVIASLLWWVYQNFIKK